MTDSDTTDPTLLEHLPPEIFIQIFTFFSIQEIITGFLGLSSYVNSLIRLVRHASLTVKYNDINSINVLQLFPCSIRRLVLFNIENIDFTSFNNLRSLTLKYATQAQIDTIRPEYLPLLETLHITGKNKLQ